MQQPSPQIYSALHSKVVELHQDMAAIKGTLAELQLDRSKHQRGMVKVAGACHSPTAVDHTRTDSNLASGNMCWYHTNFGTSVERC